MGVPPVAVRLVYFSAKAPWLVVVVLGIVTVQAKARSVTVPVAASAATGDAVGVPPFAVGVVSSFTVRARWLVVFVLGIVLHVFLCACCTS